MNVHQVRFFIKTALHHKNDGPWILTKNTITAVVRRRYSFTSKQYYTSTALRTENASLLVNIFRISLGEESKIVQDRKIWQYCQPTSFLNSFKWSASLSDESIVLSQLDIRIPRRNGWQIREGDWRLHHSLVANFAQRGTTIGNFVARTAAWPLSMIIPPLSHRVPCGLLLVEFEAPLAIGLTLFDDACLSVWIADL